MIKKITCIECPKGCPLTVDVENRRVAGVSGAKCPKGKKYAESEIERPLRVLTSAVVAEALALKMVPVRTDRPIPKARLFDAMKEIRKIRLKRPVKTGDIVVENFLNLNVNLIATRRVGG